MKTLGKLLGAPGGTFNSFPEEMDFALVALMARATLMINILNLASLYVTIHEDECTILAVLSNIFKVLKTMLAC